MKNDAKMRLLYLYKILTEETDMNRTLTTSDLAKRLKSLGIEPHRQTLAGDLAVLKDFGLDIKIEKSSPNRYCYLGRDFDIAELKLLIDAVLSSKVITQSKSKQLVEKISKLAGPVDGENLKRHISVEQRQKYDNERIFIIIDAINEAINRGSKIKFQYFKYNTKKKRILKNEGKYYIFSPHHLIWNGEFYYTVGVCDETEGVRVFRVDRIYKRPEEIENEKARPLPEDFDLSNYLSSSFRMYGGVFKEVELLCSNDVIDSIFDKFSRDIEISAQDSLHFKTKVTASIGAGFYGWIFGFKGKVKILGPSEVKEEYRELLKHAITNV